MAALTAANKRKSWNRAYYTKKKLCLLLLDFEFKAANATTTPSIDSVDSTTAIAVVTNRLSIIADIAAAADPLYFNTNGTVHTPSACWMAKSCLHTGNGQSLH
jgi:hypothetical protein